jgi:hypothetical protein
VELPARATGEYDAAESRNIFAAHRARGSSLRRSPFISPLITMSLTYPPGPNHPKVAREKDAEKTEQAKLKFSQEKLKKWLAKSLFFVIACELAFLLILRTYALHF